MASQNRTDLTATKDALAAVVDLAELKVVLANMIDSSLLKLDVTNTIAITGTGTTNVDFSGYDTIYVTTAYDCTLNIQNIVEGDVKYLHVLKAPTIEVLFTGAADQSANPTYVTVYRDATLYMVTKKIGTNVLLTPLQHSFSFVDSYSKTEGDARYAIPTDLGDKTAYDFTASDFTVDDAWHTLSLSGKIPAGAKYALLRFRLIGASGSGGRTFFNFRKYGYSNEYNIHNFNYSETNMGTSLNFNLWVPIASMNLDYKINTTIAGLSQINVVICAWM